MSSYSSSSNSSFNEDEFETPNNEDVNSQIETESVSSHGNSSSSITSEDTYEDDGYEDDGEDDYDHDSDFENDSCYDECTEILDYEVNNMIEKFENHAYYIGSYYKDITTTYHGSNSLILLLSISKPMFFAHSAKPLLFYMKNYNGISPRLRISIEILKMECITIVDGQFSYTMANVIVKTFWIKIIQRKWKSIYKKRLDAIQARGLPHAIRHFQIHGKYPAGLNQLPGICGMMADLNV
jgi:hypothetical protein